MGPGLKDSDMRKWRQKGATRAQKDMGVGEMGTSQGFGLDPCHWAGKDPGAAEPDWALGVCQIKGGK